MQITHDEFASFTFNVFNLDQLCSTRSQDVQIGRKDYYKISLIRGDKTILYPYSQMELTGTNLVFFKPGIPYQMVQRSKDFTGYFCVFSPSFAEQFVLLDRYPIWQDITRAFLALNPEQETQAQAVFRLMEKTLQSDYVFKYDLIGSYLIQLIHLLQQAKSFDLPLTPTDAETRLAQRFEHVLAAQFPIDTIAQQISLHRPQDFAHALAVHPNYLNRVLTKQYGKSTSQLIRERIVKEARQMLRHTDWSINQIAWCLGYDDVSYFIRLFKLANEMTPKEYRQRQPV